MAVEINILHIQVREGETVAVGSVVGTIETEAAKKPSPSPTAACSAPN